MSQKMKRTYGHWTVTNPNKHPVWRKPLKTIHEVNSNEGNGSDPFEKLLKSPMKQELSFKPLSFWAKKVEELEKTERKSKVKELYELSSPDGSPPTPNRKKKYRKPKPRKKKENILDNIFKNAAFGSSCQKKKPTPSKIPNEGALIKERVFYNKIANELETSLLSFKQPLPIFGLSSTPGKGKRPNVVKPSYFDFVSPIVSDTELTGSQAVVNKSEDSSTAQDKPKQILENEPTPKRPKATDFSLRIGAAVSPDEHVPTAKEQEKTITDDNEFCGFSPGDIPSFVPLAPQHVTLRLSTCLGALNRSSVKSLQPNPASIHEPLKNNQNHAWAKALNFDGGTSTEELAQSPPLNLSENASTEPHESSHSYSMEQLAIEQLPLDYFVNKRKRTKTSAEVESSPAKRLSTADKPSSPEPLLSNETVPATPSSTSDSSFVEGSSPENKTIQDANERELQHQSTREAIDHSYFLKTCSSASKVALPLGPVVLKGGKSHARALSVLRQLHTGRVTLQDQSILPQAPPGRGRGYESFVGTLLEVQPGFEESFSLDSYRRFSRLSHSRMSFAAPSRDGRFNILHQTRRSTRLSSKLNEKTIYPIQRCSSIAHQPMNKAVDSTLLAMRESFGNRTMLNNLTLCVVATEDHEPTPFRVAHGIVDKSRQTIQCSPREATLAKCGQTAPLDFSTYFNEKTLPDCVKIGEGVYGEVFMYNSVENGPTVFKVIPIEGDLLVNDEPQKTFKEILSEVVITMELSNLRNGVEQKCDGFVQLQKCLCVQGEYPDLLLDLWCQYDVNKGSDNDSPSNFDENQLYIVLELAHGGQDLESFVFQNAKQAAAAFRQITLSLAVAEKALQFEHRDFHWGNVLLASTTHKMVTYVLDGQEVTLPTEGVKVTIIDFTLSRMTYEGCAIFNDLSVDPTLFTAEGEYQFEIYRMMKEETGNNWEVFAPRTNIFWLHYTLDKMTTIARYARPKSKLHSEGLRKLQKWKSLALDYLSAASIVPAL